MAKPDWFTQEAQDIVSKGILLEGESISQAWRRVANTAEEHIKLPGLADDIFEALWKGYFGLATPILANMGTDRGLPISCNGLTIDDTMDSILEHYAELGKLTQNGAGVGCFFGNIRGAGSKIKNNGIHTGVVRFMLNYDRLAYSVTQGTARRGSAAYGIPIHHPDIELVLQAKSKEGDSRGHIDGNIYVTIPDWYMEAVLAGNLEYKRIFNKVVKSCLTEGSPYLIFVDNINKANPPGYKKHNLIVNSSNICTEITLFSDDKHTFVCCLSSLNSAKYDQWKDWLSPNLSMSAPGLLTYLLEATLTEYETKIKTNLGKSPDSSEPMKFMERALASVEKGRAIGVGLGGFHDYLQQNKIAFGSKACFEVNHEIHSFIRGEVDKASFELGQIFGVPEWCEGTPYRHSHRIAIAPTKTNSVVTNMGSECKEPYNSNYFTAKGKINRTVINRNFKKLLEEKGKDLPEIWESVRKRNGSCMHLDFLTFEEIMTYLTFREIDPMLVMRLACQSQPYVDQAISTNRPASPYAHLKQLLDPIFYAWKNGLKTLYYTKSSSSNQADKMSDIAFMVSKKECNFCDKTQKLLEERGYDVRKWDLEQIDKNYFMWDTVPRVWLDGYYIGGYEDILLYFETKDRAKTKNEGNTVAFPSIKETSVSTETEVSYEDCEACGA